MTNECPEHDGIRHVVACAHAPNRKVLLLDHRESNGDYKVNVLLDVAGRLRVYEDVWAGRRAEPLGFPFVMEMISRHATLADAESAFRAQVDLHILRTGRVA